jgi:serine protease Do
MRRAPYAVTLMSAALWLVGGTADGAPPPLTATTFIELAKAQRPVVASISTQSVPADGPGVLPPNHPAVPPASPPETTERDTPPSPSVGTGLLISADGLMLTNDHVIERSGRIVATLWNGEHYQAELVGRDPKTDLALIRLKPRDGQAATFPVARLGDSDAAEVGEWVAAIGNPFGLEQTLTIGILSGKGRALGASPYEEYLQTDASINPGSSGGPIFNIAGEVIGLATAINPSGQGIGFAIPVNQIKLLLPQLMQGKVRRGWIGVMIQPTGGAPDARRHDGALVTDVMTGSPAAQAGLARGDVIVEFDRAPITQLRDLPRRVAVAEIGTQVPVRLLRNGRPLTVTVTIGELKD